MAKKRGIFRKVLIAGVLALAVFGAWTLWNMVDGSAKVKKGVDTVEKMKSALEE